MPGEVQSLVSLTPWTIIFQICNLLIMVFVLKKFLFKPVMRVLNARQAEIDGAYSEADKAKADAMQLRNTYDQKMSEARGEADALIKAATLNAQKKSDEIVSSAKDEAGHLRKKAEQDIEQERLKAFSEVKTQLADMAIGIAEKMVKRELNGADNARLVEDFLKDAGENQ